MSRLLVVCGFLSLDGGVLVEMCRSGDLYDSRGDCSGGSLRSSVTERDAPDEKEPTRWRCSRAANCWRKAPSIVRVRGLKEGCRGGGVDETLSNDVPKESLKVTPWRLTGKGPESPEIGGPLGIDLGEDWGDTVPNPRGAEASGVTSAGSGVTALTVLCRLIPGRKEEDRRLLVDILSSGRGDGISATGGNGALCAGRAGSGGAGAAVFWDAPPRGGVLLSISAGRRLARDWFRDIKAVALCVGKQYRYGRGWG